MKKITLKIVVFTIPILLCFSILEFLLRMIPNDYVLKNDYLKIHAEELEVLILGSSHSYADINPEYLDKKSFNAAYFGQDLNQDLNILEEYVDDLKKIKTIVLPISYFSFFYRIERSKWPWRYKNYVIYYNFDNSFSLKNESEVLSTALNINITRVIDYYVKGISNIRSSALGWYSKSYSESPEGFDDNGKKAALNHSYLDWKEKEYNIDKLDEIAQICIGKDINLILVTLPANDFYRRHLNNEQLKITIEIAEEISDKYKNCYYLNLLQDPNYVQDDFLDPDHLNAKGAQKLSIYLNSFISEVDKGIKE